MGILTISVIFLTRCIHILCNKKTSSCLSQPVHFLKFGLLSYILSSLFALLLLWFTGGGTLPALTETVISALAGIALAGCTLCTLGALRSGLVVLVTLSSSAGIFLPCIAGIFLFGEQVAPLQWIGLLFLLAAIYFLSGSSKAAYGSFSARTVLLLTGTFFFDGLTMIAQKMYAVYVPQGSVTVFSTFSFFVAALILFLVYLFFPGSKTEKWTLPSKNLLFYGVILSAALLVINQLMTMASSYIPSVVLFPLVGGGNIILAGILGALFFQEKLTRQSITGMAVGIFALVLVNLF